MNNIEEEFIVLDEPEITPTQEKSESTPIQDEPEDTPTQEKLEDTPTFEEDSSSFIANEVNNIMKKESILEKIVYESHLPGGVVDEIFVQDMEKEIIRIKDTFVGIMGDYIDWSDFDRNYRTPVIVLSRFTRVRSAGQIEEKEFLAAIDELRQKIIGIVQSEGSSKEMDMCQLLLGKMRTAITENHTSMELIKEIKLRYNRIKAYEKDTDSQMSAAVKDACRGVREIMESSHSIVSSNQPVLGEYLPEFNMIMLYVNSIDEYSRKNRVSYKGKIFSVLAHEMMHAFHYNVVGENWEKGLDKTGRRNVKESLGTFFEFLYSLSQGYQDVAKMLYQELLDLFFTGWSYSKALHYIWLNSSFFTMSTEQADYETKAVKKAREVFRISTISWKQALDILNDDHEVGGSIERIV